MLKRQVLSVGQCPPDHAALGRLIEENFDAQVIAAALPSETIEKLSGGRFDLVLINRKLDADYSDGIEIIKQLKSDPDLTSVPVMLVSNYPQSQQEAVSAGAELGFGKLEFGNPETLEKLRKFLS